MPEYRISKLLRANEIAGPPIEVECASDLEAVAEAKKLSTALVLRFGRARVSSRGYGLRTWHSRLKLAASLVNRG
jgi:hypothetical protein